MPQSDPGFTNCDGPVRKALSRKGLAAQDFHKPGPLWPLFDPLNGAQYPKKYPKQKSPTKTGIP